MLDADPVVRADFRKSRREWRGLSALGVAPGRKALAVASLHSPGGVKLDSAMGLIWQAAGYRTVVVDFHGDDWTRRYRRIFGADEIRGFESWLREEPVPDFSYPKDPGLNELLEYEYEGYAIGRIALSNLINAGKFQSLDPGEEGTRVRFLAELRGIWGRIRAAERLLAEVRPDLVVFLEKGVSPFAEIFLAAIRKNIPVIQYVGSQSTTAMVFKRYKSTNAYEHPFSLDDATWNRIKAHPAPASKFDAIMDDFKDGYVNGTWFKRKHLHEEKHIASADEVRRELGIGGDRKTAVIFSHVLWDATFFYGKGLFRDYEEWLQETVRAAVDCKGVDWIVKLHPDLVWKLKYEKPGSRLRDFDVIREAAGGASHIRIVPPETKISTFSFFDITDICVTVRGTIGIEMACHGVPVLTAGTGRYSGRGFTIDSQDRDEYLRRIRTAHQLEAMSPDATNLARRYAYALFRMRPWQMRSFETVYGSLGGVGKPTDWNVVPRAMDKDSFLSARDTREAVKWLESQKVDYMDWDVLSAQDGSPA